MKKIRRNKHGFTIIELTVVMIIMGIMSLTMANFIINWLQASSLAQARANLLTTAENALDTMTSDVKLSGSVDLNNRWSDQYGPGGQYSWSSGGQVLILAKAAVDNTNNIIFSDPSKYISEKNDEIYYISGSTLYRRTLADPNDSSDSAITTCPSANASSSCPADQTVAEGVSSLSFTYYDANEDVVSPENARSVQASLTLTSSQGGQSASATYTTRMVFRNE